MIERYEIDHKLESFISAWIIDHSICDELIEQYELHKDLAIDDTNGYRGYKGITNLPIDSEVSHKYCSIIDQCIIDYNKRYEWCGKLATFLSTPFNIQRYEPGNNYKVWHIEDSGPTPGKFVRHLVFLTYLNDIEEGGGTEFLYQDVHVKPKKGLTLLWPAGWTHPHRGIVAPNEIKYISTGWSCFNHRVK